MTNEPVDHHLGQDQVDLFRQRGWIVIPDVFKPPEVAMLSTAALEVMEREGPEVGREADGSPHVCWGMHLFDERLGTLTKHPALVEPSRQLLGSDIFVHQSRINMKQTNGSIVAWHQDFGTYHRVDGVPEPRGIMIAVFLDDVTAVNAPLLAVPGSQAEGLVSTAAIDPSAPDFEEVARYRYDITHETMSRSGRRAWFGDDHGHGRIDALHGYDRRPWLLGQHQPAAKIAPLYKRVSDRQPRRKLRTTRVLRGARLFTNRVVARRLPGALRYGMSGQMRMHRFEPIPSAPVGAFVQGFDPAAGIDADAIANFAAGLADHGVLVIRGQEIDAEQLVAIGRSLGDLEILPEPDKRHPDHPEIFNLSNVKPDDEIVSFDEPQAVFLRGTERWHTDSSFREIPCLCTMLYAVEVPDGQGQTEFANMRAAYAALPAERKEVLGDVQVIHSYEYSRANNPGRMEPMSDEERAKYPPVSHPLVRTHHDGQRSLYFGGHASHIEGRAEDEGRRELAELESLATAPKFVYRHEWQPNDLVIWDNRSVLHRLLPYDIARHRRVMRRITVAGTEPVV